MASLELQFVRRLSAVDEAFKAISSAKHLTMLCFHTGTRSSLTQNQLKCLDCAETSKLLCWIIKIFKTFQTKDRPS